MLRSLRYYYLFQAYELLGSHLYGRQWTGQEYAYRDLQIASPEELAAQRRPIEGHIARLDREIAELGRQIGRTVSEPEIRAAQQRRDELSEEKSKRLSELRERPEPNDSNRRDYEAVQRHRHTEERLFEALRKSELTAHLDFGAHVPADMWRGARGFKVYSWLSLAIMPRTFSRLRRASIGFLREEFDPWLSSQIPIVQDPSNPISADVLCRDFLKSEFSRGVLQTKQQYRDAANKLRPPPGKREFDRLWAELAPPRFKERGRRPGITKSQRP